MKDKHSTLLLHHIAGVHGAPHLVPCRHRPPPAQPSQQGIAQHSIAQHSIAQQGTAQRSHLGPLAAASWVARPGRAPAAAPQTLYGEGTAHRGHRDQVRQAGNGTTRQPIPSTGHLSCCSSSCRGSMRAARRAQAHAEIPIAMGRPGSCAPGRGGPIMGGGPP